MQRGQQAGTGESVQPLAVQGLGVLQSSCPSPSAWSQALTANASPPPHRHWKTRLSAPSLLPEKLS